MLTSERSICAQPDIEPANQSTTMAPNEPSAMAGKKPTTTTHQEFVTQTQVDTAPPGSVKANTTSKNKRIPQGPTPRAQTDPAPTPQTNPTEVESTSSPQHKPAPESPTEAEPDLRYIKLDPGYNQYASWSNHPHDLDLYGAFRAEEPNLSTDFDVDGLKSILRKNNFALYLLKDAKDICYLWNPWDGHLLKVSDEFATEDNLNDDDDDDNDGFTREDLDGVEKVVSNIIDNLYWALKVAKPVFRT